MTPQGWASLSVQLRAWGRAERDLGPETHVWLKESTTVLEARAAWEEFAAAGVQLLDLQIFSISEDPPGPDSEE